MATGSSGEVLDITPTLHHAMTERVPTRSPSDTTKSSKERRRGPAQRRAWRPQDPVGPRRAHGRAINWRRGCGVDRVHREPLGPRT